MYWIFKIMYLKIKCICNSYLQLSERQENLTISSFYCPLSSCKYFRFYIVEAFDFLPMLISLGGKTGFSSALLNDGDYVFLKQEEFNKVLELYDVNKYIEKYNNLILFK